MKRLRLAAALAVAAVAATVAPAAGAGERAHQHGMARLDVAVEAKRITLQFDTPLDNLLGFERAPRNDAERRQADAAIARLKAAATMFRIDPAAGCTLGSVELASAALKLGAAKAVENADKNSDNRSDHADLEGSFEFSCEAGAKAAYIDTALFAFPTLRQVDVQVAAPAGQFKRTLTRAASRIVLAK